MSSKRYTEEHCSPLHSRAAPAQAAPFTQTFSFAIFTAISYLLDSGVL